uniref:UDP-glucuronosyltransferase n=1 Tax=Parastrongyloides trichosuri TaxID=131310 RepID=A0A0N5A5P6_PARTI
MIKVLSLLFILALSTNGYKILIYNPKIGHSHVNFFGKIADALVDAGHDVTVLVVHMDLSIKHPGASKAKIFNYYVDSVITDLFTNKTRLDQMWETSDTVWAQIDMFNDFTTAQILSGKQLLNDENLTQYMINEKFDLGITEVFNIYMYGLFKIWGINASVSGSAVGLMDNDYETFGLHFPASHIPTLMQGSTDKMTYGERFNNLISYFFTKIFYIFTVKEYTLQNEFDKKYGPEFFKPMKDMGDTSFLLLNSNPYLDIAGPKTPKMIEIAGIGRGEPKSLDKYWDGILSLRKHTVLISFGSFAKTSAMPLSMKRGIIETAKALPEITFIWKYEKPEDGIGNGIDNLILSKWTPQSDLLNDKRLSLFITHGGANSIVELAFTGKPTIAVPIFGDQFRNAKLVEKHNIGVVMDKSELKNSYKLIKNIQNVLSNKLYRKNAELLSKRLNKRPISSKELLVKHVEFACEFGKLEVLDLESRNMNSITYFNLDIIIPILIFFSLITTFVFSKLNALSKKIFCIKKEKKD